MYGINQDNGLLTPLSPSTIATGTLPSSIAFDRYAFLAYVPNFSVTEPTISMYKMNPDTGMLTPLNPATIPAQKLSTVISKPWIQYAHVLSIGTSNDPTIGIYSTDTSTGILTPQLSDNLVFGSGTLPAITFPYRGFSYAAFKGASPNQNKILHFYNDPYGSLSLIESIPTQFTPDDLILHDTMNYLYVIDSEQFKIYGFSIDADNNGKLTPLGSPVFSGGPFNQEQWHLIVTEIISM